MAASLLLTGRCQINRDPADGKSESAALGGSTDTFPCFLHCRIRQANDIKTGQSVGDIAFGCDSTSMDAMDTQGADTADHKPATPS